MARKKKSYAEDVMDVTGTAMGVTVGAGVVSTVGAMTPGVPAGVGANVQGAMGLMSIAPTLQASKKVLKRLEDLK